MKHTFLLLTLFLTFNTIANDKNDEAKMENQCSLSLQAWGLAMLPEKKLNRIIENIEKNGYTVAEVVGKPGVPTKAKYIITYNDTKGEMNLTSNFEGYYMKYTRSRLHGSGYRILKRLVKKLPLCVDGSKLTLAREVATNTKATFEHDSREAESLYKSYGERELDTIGVSVSFE